MCLFRVLGRFLNKLHLFKKQDGDQVEGKKAKVDSEGGEILENICKTVLLALADVTSKYPI